MITFDKATNQGVSKRYVEGKCLSADTKPTSNIANGSILIEMDTGKIFMFDEANSQWKEFG